MVMIRDGLLGVYFTVALLVLWLTLTSKAARISDALLRDAHGDAHVTRLRVNGCMEQLHDSFDAEHRQHACFGLMRVKFEGPPLNAILLNRVDAALRWFCTSQRAIFNESEGCFVDSLYVRLMDAFRIEDEHSARCAAQICCRLASDDIFTSRRHCDLVGQRQAP